MCFWKNLANFVGMKNSIDFLPERKQRDLRELAALIRDEVKDVARIIDDRTGQQGIEYVEAQDMY